MQRAGGVPANIEVGALGEAMLEAARSARIGVTVTMVEGPRPHVVYVSDHAAQIMGWSVEELLEGDPLQRIAPEYRAEAAARLADRAGGSTAERSFEIDILRKDGRRIPIEIATSAVNIDGRRAVFSFLVDVSARRSAENERLRNEARFRELIESAPEPIGIIRDGYFVYANPAYRRALGFSDPAALYSTPTRSILDPSEVDVCVAREARLQAGHKQPSQIYHVRRTDGTVLLLEVSSVCFEYEGKPAILNMARDITARRRLETQLVQNDRLAALGTLAAGVAHEINNPLAYLMLNLEWVVRNLPSMSHDPESVRSLVSMLEEAQQGAECVSTIVRDLRSFSRADGETRRAVDVAAVAQSAIKIAGHEIRRHARVVTTFDPAQPVWANNARLEQVMVNLLLNAAQSMSAADAQRNEIRVSVRGLEGQTLLEVADNGAGIAADVLPRIFDPFYSTKPVGVGTGLGLSICHGIVTSLGGKISAYSALGEGSTFRVTLPATERRDAEPGSGSELPTVPSLPHGVRAQVLVVDDEAPIADLMRELLANDHDVAAATSAHEALAILDSEKAFDVIFCDLMMPEMSGIQLYELLRKKKPGLEARIVFMTGGGFTTSAAEFLATIGNRRLEKPFSLGVVEEIAREMAASRLHEGPR
ncbi:MAG: PAS domain S-box protein [Myxococcota bacterium]|nr:PAS domain S-box protein [Myxococcota bacterium]